MRDPKLSRAGEGPPARVQVQFAIDDPARADRMVDQLLDDRLVACGQRIGPVVSRYRWHGAVERAEEWLVLLKTRTDLVPAVIGAVLAAHPYETPEVVVLDLVGGAPDYLAWIDEVTTPAATIGRTGDTEAR